MSYVGDVVSGGNSNLVASTLFGTCSTVSATASKVVECEDFDALIPGVTIHVKFIYSNLADEPTLNVNGTGAFPIYTDGVNYPGKTALTSWQPNSVVSLTHDGTAWRMNDVGAPTSNTVPSILNLVYPIGAIYMSVNSTNPGALFGGTWEQLKDTFLLAAGTTHAAASTGGTETNTLSIDNLPSHSHTVGAHAHGLNSHTHSVGAHSHGLNGHTHTIPSLSGSAGSNGAHSHSLSKSVLADVGTTWQTGAQVDMLYTAYATTSVGTNSAGAHTHSVTTNSSTTGGNSGSTANSAAFNTGAAAGNTANSSQFNSGAVGSGEAVNNMPPYLAVYCWKRIA